MRRIALTMAGLALAAGTALLGAPSASADPEQCGPLARMADPNIYPCACEAAGGHWVYAGIGSFCDGVMLPSLPDDTVTAPI